MGIFGKTDVKPGEGVLRPPPPAPSPAGARRPRGPRRRARA